MAQKKSVPQKVVKVLCLQLAKEDPEEGAADEAPAEDAAADGEEAAEEKADEGGDAAGDDGSEKGGEEAAADQGEAAPDEAAADSVNGDEDADANGAEEPGDANEAADGGERSPEEQYDEYPSKRRRPLPEQGFHTPGLHGPKRGDMVEHASKKTYTADWGREFGKPSGHRSYREICRDHPKNQWCRLHRFSPEEDEWQRLSPPEELREQLASEVPPPEPETVDNSHQWHMVLLVAGLSMVAVGLLVGLLLLCQGGYLCPSPGVRVLTN